MLFSIYKNTTTVDCLQTTPTYVPITIPNAKHWCTCSGHNIGSLSSCFHYTTIIYIQPTQFHGKMWSSNCWLLYWVVCWPCSCIVKIAMQTNNNKIFLTSYSNKLSISDTLTMQLIYRHPLFCIFYTLCIFLLVILTSISKIYQWKGSLNQVEDFESKWPYHRSMLPYFKFESVSDKTYLDKFVAGCLNSHQAIGFV